jgi:hypothetical protein
VAWWVYCYSFGGGCAMLVVGPERVAELTSHDR